jgi:hypothetical protein
MVDIADTCGILGLTECKFSHGGCSSWNEVDGVDLLLAFLP